jgi:hypothetical protein
VNYLKLSRRKLFSLVVVLVTAVALPAAAALFFVYPPGSWPNAKPYSVHAADWWRWMASLPLDRSPLIEDSGVNCAQGQSGLTWYLAGTVGTTVSRNCTIPSGRTLIIPVLNTMYGAYSTDPAEWKTDAYLRSQVDFMEDATDLEVEIDGVAVPNVESYLERSVQFSVTLPANNIFGEPAGRVLSPAVDSGYYLAVSPLLPGDHTIHFHGRLPGDPETAEDDFVVDVTYNLRIKLLPF